MYFLPCRRSGFKYLNTDFQNNSIYEVCTLIKAILKLRKLMLKKFVSLFKIAQFANKRWNLGAHPVD